MFGRQSVVTGRNMFCMSITSSAVLRDEVAITELRDLQTFKVPVWDNIEIERWCDRARAKM
jgi:hypothetical protein